MFMIFLNPWGGRVCKGMEGKHCLASAKALHLNLSTAKKKSLSICTCCVKMSNFWLIFLLVMYIFLSLYMSGNLTLLSIMVPHCWISWLCSFL
jgi:hypothetical protein